MGMEEGGSGHGAEYMPHHQFLLLHFIPSTDLRNEEILILETNEQRGFALCSVLGMHLARERSLKCVGLCSNCPQ